MTTLACIINSSVFVTNKSNDNEYLNMLSQRDEFKENQVNNESEEMNSKIENMNQTLVRKETEGVLKDKCGSIQKNENDMYVQKKLNQMNVQLEKNKINDNPKKDNTNIEKFKSRRLPKNNENIKHEIFQKKINCTKVEQTNNPVITGYATAYTAAPGAHTANGRVPVAGVDCAMNKKYMDKKIKATVGDKEYILYVTDHGKAVNSNNGTILDIYMDSYNECIAFGRRPVTVQFLN